jgi:hypothetical protein
MADKRIKLDEASLVQQQKYALARRQLSACVLSSLDRRILLGNFGAHALQARSPDVLFDRHRVSQSSSRFRYGWFNPALNNRQTQHFDRSSP